MRKITFIAALAVLGASDASADHYLQTADPQVIGGINEMVQILNVGCNNGNGAACNAIPMLLQEAHWMLSAGYNCGQNGNQQACDFYNWKFVQLEQAYNELTFIAQNGGLIQNTGGGPGMGLTHEQRMQQIHDFGAQNTANFNARTAASTANHEAFLETIRQ